MRQPASIVCTKYLFGAALLAAASLASAQPTFGNPSPTAGRDTSQKANAAADQSIYQPVVYANAGKKGPAVIVIPGEIKSNNATFIQKFTANNIADFGEVEMSSANFTVLERSNLGPLLKEFELAYNLGAIRTSAQVPEMGKLRPPIRREIRHPRPNRCRGAARVRRQNAGDRRDVGGVRRGARRARRAQPLGSVHSNEATPSGSSASLQDHQCRDDRAVAGSTPMKRWERRDLVRARSVFPIAPGGVSLDTMCQRRVQKSVWESTANTSVG